MIFQIWPTIGNWLTNHPGFRRWTFRIGVVAALFGSGMYVGSRIAKPDYDVRGGSIFEDSVMGKSIEYKEGVGENNKTNYMSFEKAGFKYEMFDTSGASSIDWQLLTAPDFSKDELEKLVITDESGVSTLFERSKLDPNTVNGKRMLDIFGSADKSYNDVRSQIRVRLQTDQDKYFDRVKRGLE